MNQAQLTREAAVQIEEKRIIALEDVRRYEKLIDKIEITFSGKDTGVRVTFTEESGLSDRARFLKLPNGWTLRERPQDVAAIAKATMRLVGWA